MKKILYLAFELPILQLKDITRNSVAQTTIPKVVYQTWESRYLPRRLRREIVEFRERNRDFSFKLFDRRERDFYMQTNWGHRPVFEIYQSAAFGQIKADIFRYCILFDNGGFYFDINKGIRSSLGRLLEDNPEAVISFEGHNERLNFQDLRNTQILLPHHYIIQWGMAFKAQHGILKLVLRNIEDSFHSFESKMFQNPKKAILEFSGPIAFTKAVHEFEARNTLVGVKQVGVDFEGQGIFTMRGSGAKYIWINNYSQDKDRKLFLK
jgi:mannosyltransferase OCH1-like enzyme